MKKMSLQIILLIVGFSLFATLCLMGIMGGEEKEVKYKSRNEINWKEVDRQLVEIEKNEQMIEFLLCKMKLIDRVSYDTPNYNNVIDSIAHSEDRELILKECKR